MSLTISLFGDVLINRASPDAALERLAPIFEGSDAVIGNLEGVLTDNFNPIPGRLGTTIAPARNAAGLRGFDVMSLANNHAMDNGREGLLDMVRILKQAGVLAVGAGLSIERAWDPAFLETAGKTIAVIAATAVYKCGSEATAAQAGTATIRSSDYYCHPFPGVVVPGAPPKIISNVNEDDLEKLRQAIARARERADYVIVSMHWGDHTRQAVLTDPEKRVAKVLAQAGADLVFGHHHHALRGAETIGEMPVLYGLGNLVFDQPDSSADLRFQADTALPTNFQFPENSRFTAAAIVQFGGRGERELFLVPIYIDEDDSPRTIARASERWQAFQRLFDAAQAVTDGSYRLVDEGSQFGLDVFTLAAKDGSAMLRNQARRA